MRMRSQGKPLASRVAPWALLVLVGCGGGATDELPRRAVSGSVTFNGKPLGSGSIAFDPVGGSANPTSGGSLVQGGSYSIAQAMGLTPGTYMVSIRSGGDTALPLDEAPGAPPRKAAKDPIPDKYNNKSGLKVELKDGGTTRFDFDLKS